MPDCSLQKLRHGVCCIVCAYRSWPSEPSPVGPMNLFPAFPVPWQPIRFQRGEASRSSCRTKRLQLVSCQWNGGENRPPPVLDSRPEEDYVFSAPTFEISSVPGRAVVKIEDVDRYEDGLLVWQISKVQWADGNAYVGTEKLTEKKAAPVNWARVEREKTPVGEPTPPQNLDNERQN